MPDWLIDRSRPPTQVDLDEIDRRLAAAEMRSRGGRRNVRPLAVSLHDVTIHEVRKWFGDAKVRIDALVVTGCGSQQDPQSFYMPKTATFERISSGDRLPIGSGGLLIFYGPASHFLDVRIMASRDRRDAQDLGQLLAGTLGSAETSKSLTSLFGLAVAAPQAAAVSAAVQGASALGELAFRVLQAATGGTIGLHRDCHLEFRDGFGIGRHPGPVDETYRAQDLSFRYEIRREGPTPSSVTAKDRAEAHDP